MKNKEKYTQLIKTEAKRLGFYACGIAKARFLEEEAPRFEKWLSENKNGQMQYLENHFDKRLDPRLLVPGAKSVISLIYPYYPHKLQENKSAPIISKYAYGEDYHFVIKDKLKLLFNFIKEKTGEISGRYFTDSAPVLEKKWAELAGIGWRAKNSNLLTKNGSFFFIAEIILDLELEYDYPTKNYCGNCTKCIEACPTQAITQEYSVDGSKCISYFTIELKDKIPKEMSGKFQNRVFGCDICQDVCPHNRKPVFHKEERFFPHPDLLKMTKSDWHNISEEKFREIFKKSSVKRTKYKGLIRNLDFLTKQE